MAHSRNVKITLNPNGVIAPALTTLRTTVEVVGFCLATFEGSDLSDPPGIGGMGMELSFAPNGSDASQRRSNYTHWILARGFHELARGVRQSLEEAYFYVGLAELQGSKSTWGKFQTRIVELRREANGFNFPTLLKCVNRGLIKSLSFETEFLSLNRVRNCLEHRGGVVSKLDVDDGTDALVLSFPRLMMCYVNDGVDVELVRGMRVEGGAEIFIKRTIKKSRYGLGERISFTREEFQDIGMACWFFAQDLASKLPRPQDAAVA